MIVLLSNHKEMVCESRMSNLPCQHTDGSTIFVHAGIEEAEDYRKYATIDIIFTEKYHTETGDFYENYKMVAGYVQISGVSGNPCFNDGFYDGESHYYIDANIV